MLTVRTILILLVVQLALSPLVRAQSTFGNIVGIVQGLGVFKRFRLGDRIGLRVEATFTNVLNVINYAPPSTNVSNPATFGVLQAVLPQGAGGNRTGQVAARLTF